jgi:hypothetical protein
MDMLERFAWLGLALIHLMPAMALLTPGGLARLYGIKPGGAVLVPMEHRTLLFAGILVLCLWSAIEPQPRPAALVATAISVLGYFALYLKSGSPPGPLRTIAKVDLLALPLLAFIAVRLFLR